MKTVRNKTRRPLRIPLPGGKFLHLGPNRTGQVADPAVERPAVKALIRSGEIEVLGEDNPAWSEGGGSSPHEATRAHRQATNLGLSKGNR